MNEHNNFSYDIISIRDELQTILSDKTSHPYTLISLDQFTPLTIGRIRLKLNIYYSDFIGVLIGVYQMSIFFENIIRKNLFEENDIDFIDQIQ